MIAAFCGGRQPALVVRIDDQAPACSECAGACETVSVEMPISIPMSAGGRPPLCMRINIGSALAQFYGAVWEFDVHDDDFLVVRVCVVN